MVSGGAARAYAGRAGGEAGIGTGGHPLNYIISIMTNPGIGVIVVTVENEEDG